MSRYEYRIKPDAPCTVQVRRVPATGRPTDWYPYMRCINKVAAERVLKLLLCIDQSEWIEEMVEVEDEVLP